MEVGLRDHGLHSSIRFCSSQQQSCSKLLTIYSAKVCEWRFNPQTSTQLSPPGPQIHMMGRSEFNNGRVCINEVLPDDWLRAILAKLNDMNDRNNYGLVCKASTHRIIPSRCETNTQQNTSEISRSHAVYIDSSTRSVSADGRGKATSNSSQSWPVDGKKQYH